VHNAAAPAPHPDSVAEGHGGPARLWFRLVVPERGAFGPGKAQLLDAIVRTGSIAAAGREMGMSYRRAWRMVEEINTAFGNRLVETERGGERGGGSRLTGAGVQALEIYRGLARELDATAQPWLDRLRRLGEPPC
jgi:molybdate transport system regulatory protein